MMQRELFRSANVVVRCVPAEDQTRWVVTFDNYGLGPGFDRQGFGERFFREAGVSAIHVMGVRDDWYQYPEMDAAMATVREAVAGADRVMTYGSSMGGYAALRFADSAGANAAVALSPQYSVDPQKTPFETRWSQDGRRISWLPEIDGRIECKIRPVVVFDPTMEDGLHAERIHEDIDIQPIRLPYIAHPASTYLIETKLLKSLVFQTLSGELDAVAFEREARSRRRMSGFYMSNLAMRQPASRRGLALRLASQAVAVSHPHSLACLAMARLLSAEGRHDDAIEKVEGVVVATNRAPVYLVSYVDALMAAGRYEEARPHAREAVEALSHQAHLHAWEGVLLQRLGESELAIEAVQRAIALDSQPQYLALLEAYRGDVDADIGKGRPVTWASRVFARIRPALRAMRKA